VAARSAGAPAPAGLGGLEEFRSGASWTAPPGVTRLLVEAWGGGGGGGAGSAAGSGGGGGGGAGAYQRAVVEVMPGATYRVETGAGGAAGAPGTSGGSGGDTRVVTASTGAVLFVSRGGLGGGVASDAGGPGRGGAGGRAEPRGGIARPGPDGAPGSTCRPAPLNPSTCLTPAGGGAGGPSARGTVDPPGAAGAGGAGGDGGRGGQAGSAGYAILQW
jgi:hypothetical protein